MEVASSKIRLDIIKNSNKTKTPHLGSCLSCVDLINCIYSRLNIEKIKNNHPDRDRFILSKGHAAPALFITLNLYNLLPDELLENYGKDGSYLAEHPPAPGHVNGIEAATGSLGHGLPLAIGINQAAVLKKIDFITYVLMGDGECNEGTVWEAALYAGSRNLKNLCVLIDFNKWQATGRSNEINNLNNLKQKWESFGWHSIEINGHDINDINSSLDLVGKVNKPVAIIANTIKGKGVSFMEDDNNWHYRIPNDDEVLLAADELGEAIEK
jgi:transketolase